MQIAKSKGVEDIGHMESKIREMGRDLATVKHAEAIKISHLEAENEMLRKQLQERETQVETEMLRKQLQDRETQLACMASWAMEALQRMQPAK